MVQPAPGIPTSADGLPRPFACFRPSSFGLALCPVPGRASAGRCTGGSRPPTPGVLRSGPSSVVSVPPRYYDPIRQSRRHAATSRLLPLIRHAFAVRERLGDPRDLPYFPRPAFSACRRPYASGSAQPSRCAGHAIPGFLGLRASRPHKIRLCQLFRRCGPQRLVFVRRGSRSSSAVVACGASDRAGRADGQVHRRAPGAGLRRGRAVVETC